MEITVAQVIRVMKENMDAAIKAVRESTVICSEYRPEFVRILEIMAGREPEREETYSIGDRFTLSTNGPYDGYSYMLARIAGGLAAGTVALINLRSGARWNAGRSVDDSRHITQREFDGIAGSFGKFTRIHRAEQ